jgi:glycosyltransferase involved in cell wall biosynthesis
MAPMVSIVIPAFNEAARIGNTIQKVHQFLERFPFPYELIIVDDGSGDKTPTILDGLRFQGMRVLRNETNHGKGYSVRQGVLAASGEYVVFSDADLSTPIEELQKLLDVALKDNADIVIGSRAVDRSLIEIRQSRLRESGGILFNFMVRMMLGLKLQDTQCGFKLFKRERVTNIFTNQTIHGFGFDPEILFVASREKLRIVEVPVRWSHAEGSKIRFMRDGVRMFTDILRIRRNYFLGRYS